MPKYLIITNCILPILLSLYPIEPCISQLFQLLQLLQLPLAPRQPPQPHQTLQILYQRYSSLLAFSSILLVSPKRANRRISLVREVTRAPRSSSLSLIPNLINRDTSQLRILQANYHQSKNQMIIYLFSKKQVQEYKILAIQELEIYYQIELVIGTYSQSLGSRFYILLRPIPTTTLVETRELQPYIYFFVSKQLDPKTWSVRYYSRDLSTLTFTTSASIIYIYNIYLPGKVGSKGDSSGSKVSTGLAILRAILATNSGQYIIISDFNLYYLLQLVILQSQYFDNDTKSLIYIIGDYRLNLLIPRGIVTFEGPIFSNIVRSTIDFIQASPLLTSQLIRYILQRQWQYSTNYIPILTEFDIRQTLAIVIEC